MSTQKRTHATLTHEVEKAEIVAGLRRAFDLQYQRLCRLARADWERLVGSDPADASVTIRIQTAPSIATRGSGFLKSRRPTIAKIVAKNPVPRFAQ
jgi:hypothetical protein